MKLTTTAGRRQRERYLELCLRSPGLGCPALLGGRSRSDDLQYHQWHHCRRSRWNGRAGRARRRDPGDLAGQVEISVVGVADQSGPQENRDHVHRHRHGHALPRDHRSGIHARAAGRRAGRGLSVARTLRRVLHDSRHDHDLFHGDAVPYRHHQLRHAAADRCPRSVVSGHESDQPWPYRSGRGDRDDFTGAGAILHWRLEWLSPLYGTVLQP